MSGVTADVLEHLLQRWGRPLKHLQKPARAMHEDAADAEVPVAVSSSLNDCG
jgi:hypothetical protein